MLRNLVVSTEKGSKVSSISFLERVSWARAGFSIDMFVSIFHFRWEASPVGWDVVDLVFCSSF